MPPRKGAFRQRDLLPFPLPSLEALYHRQGLRKCKRFRRKANPTNTKEIHILLWKWLIIHSLNFEYCGRGDAAEWAHASLHSLAHRQALQGIHEAVEYFCANVGDTFAAPDWEKEVQERSIDYNGDETLHALPIRLDELKLILTSSAILSTHLAGFPGLPVLHWLEVFIVFSSLPASIESGLAA